MNWERFSSRFYKPCLEKQQAILGVWQHKYVENAFGLLEVWHMPYKIA
jgi:hypothetical protein